MTQKKSKLSHQEYADNILELLKNNKKLCPNWVLAALGRPATNKRFKVFIQEVLPQVCYGNNYLCLREKTKSSQYAKKVREMVKKNNGQVKVEDLDKLLERPDSALPYEKFIENLLPEMKCHNNIICLKTTSDSTLKATQPTKTIFPDETILEASNPHEDSNLVSTKSSISNSDFSDDPISVSKKNMAQTISKLSHLEYANKVLEILKSNKIIYPYQILDILGRPATNKKFIEFIQELLPQLCFEKDRLFLREKPSSSQYATKVREMVKINGQVKMEDLDKLLERPDSTLPYEKFIENLLPEMKCHNNIICLKTTSDLTSKTTPTKRTFSEKTATEASISSNSAFSQSLKFGSGESSQMSKIINQQKISPLNNEEYAKSILEFLKKNRMVSIEFVVRNLGRPNTTKNFKEFINEVLPSLCCEENFLHFKKKPSSSQYATKVREMVKNNGQVNVEDLDTIIERPNSALPYGKLIETLLPEMKYQNKIISLKITADATPNPTTHSTKKISPEETLSVPSNPPEDFKAISTNSSFSLGYDSSQTTEFGSCESSPSSISPFTETNLDKKNSLEKEKKRNMEGQQENKNIFLGNNINSFLESARQYTIIATDDQFETDWPSIRSYLVQNISPVTFKCHFESGCNRNEAFKLKLLLIGIFRPKYQEYHAILLSGELKEKNLVSLFSSLALQKGIFGHNMHRELEIFSRYNDSQEKPILFDTQLALELWTGKLHNSWRDLYSFFGVSIPDEAPLVMEKALNFRWKPGNSCEQIPLDVMQGLAFEVTLLGSACQAICAKMSNNELRMIEEAGLSLSSPKVAQMVYDNSNYFLKSTSLFKGDPEDLPHIVDVIPFCDKQYISHFFPPSFCAKFPPYLFHESKKITIDLNQRPVFTSLDSCHIGTFEVGTRQMTECLSYLGRIGSDDRIIVDKALHRISVIRDKSNRIYGITYLQKYHYYQSSSLIKDLYLIRTNHQSHGIILFGKSKSGKSTILRDAVINIATDRSPINVSVIDTKQDILGNGDQPYFKHPKCRRILNNGKHQDEMILDCINNHAPSHIIVDEIKSQEDLNALYEAKQVGVHFMAGFRGSLAEYWELCKLDNQPNGISHCPFSVAIFLLNQDPLEIDIVRNFPGAIGSFKNDPNALVEVERRTRNGDSVYTSLILQNLTKEYSF